MALESKKRPRNSGRLIPVIIVIVLCVVVAVVYQREDEHGLLHGIQSSVASFFTPVSSVGVAVDSGLTAAGEGISDAVASEETVSQLKEEIAALRQQLAEDEEYRIQAENLKNLLNLKEVYGVDGIAAQVIGRSSQAWNQTITIAAGEDDGVQIGQTVSGGTGVIGQVIATTASTSTVRLITDSQSGVAALLQSNRREGIVTGSLDGLLYLSNVDSSVMVQVGDVVVTSGMGGSYVRGLIIGQVVKVTDSSGDASRIIVVSPNDNPATVETVMVIKSMSTSGAAS